MAELQPNTSNPPLTKPAIYPALAAYQFTSDQVSRGVQQLAEKYGQLGELVMVEGLVRDLVSAFGDLSQLRGKRILDLGCGGTGSFESRWLRDTPMRRTYEPWLCRLCHLHGAEVVGVDSCVSPSEPFRALRRDLTKPGVLADLPTGYFDAINMRLFLSSPHLAQMLDQDQRIALGSTLQKEAVRLLKSDGLTIRWDTSVNDL